MAEGDIVVYNGFKTELLKGTHNLVEATHDIKITLHTAYTPNIDTHLLFGTAGVSSTEYGTADGYTAGGKSLANQTVTQDDAGDRALLDADDITWTALGALTPATPSHAILWNDTQTSPVDPLICYVELGTTATNGGDYTIAWDTSPSAIISLT